MDIWRAAEILNRRKWLILFSVIITAALTYGATRLTGSRWTATVKLLAPQTASKAVNGGDAYEAGPNIGDGKALNSLYNTILLSREVVEPAYKKIKENLPTGAELFKEIEFNTVGSRLFQIQVTSSTPEKAEMLANALAESFVQRNHAINSQETGKVVELLQSQLNTANSDLAKIRNKYREYSKSHKVIGTSDEEARSARGEIDSARARANVIQQELAAAQVRLSDYQRRLGEVEASLSGLRPEIIGPHAKSISDEIDRISSKLASLQARYGVQHPEVKETLATRATLIERLKNAQTIEGSIIAYDEKTTLRTSLQKNIIDLKPRIEELNAQKSTLENVISQAETRVADAKDLSDPYSSIVSEVNARQEARSAIVSRLNSALMAYDIAQRQNPIVILERVNSLNPPMNTTEGRTIKLTVIAAICAIFGSCAIIIALDSVDRRVKNVNEAEKSLPTRILAAIPQPEGVMSYSDLARIAELNPRSLSSEAYRFLALHMLTGVTPNMRSLMVISAKAEQGSTTTITNLAITLAQAGKKVVLVDANTRTAELHQVFKTNNEFGFTDLLMDPTISSFERALMSTTVENLQIITSGTFPDNPWELFRSTNLKVVSTRLRDIADYVLYDTPSGVMFTDALNLAPIVDGAFLCVRALETPTGVEKRLVDLINQSNVTVLGAVLNDVPVSMVAGYENYRHYYASAMANNAVNASNINPASEIPKLNSNNIKKDNSENIVDMRTYNEEEM
jgi:capsular exopolysaccharide synthesis family protein